MAQDRIDVEPTAAIRWPLALIAVATLTVSCASAPPKPTTPAAAQSMRSEFGATDVQVDNGVAHLSGYVWSADAIYQARKIARNVPGVTGVSTSQLQLERNGRDTGPAR